MKNTEIKDVIRKRQNGSDALAELELPADPSLWDLNRRVPKRNGGKISLKNTQGINAITNMVFNGNYRERDNELHELKNMIDGREQVRKFLNSCNNRILAMQRRTDDLDEITLEWLKLRIKEISSFLTGIDRRIIKHLKSMGDPLIKSAMGVKGIGPITIAYMLVYIDIEKAEYAGNLWSYVGIVKPSHERYTKNIAGGGNKTLRTMLYIMADSMVKTRSTYRDVYDNEKAKLSKSLNIVKTRNTQGKLIECPWKDAKPSHRHGAALRKIMKHFLADWWLVARTLRGLPVAEPYVIGYLGHKDWIRPEERGWNY